jgi:polysaccharide pyruvyl transferase CsaB
METYKVKSINRLNPIKIFSHMRKADMLISGGGTLIQDRTSTKSLWYYLIIISIALKNKLKVMLYSNGIGPLERKGNIKRTKKILDRADLITLRDDCSYETLRNLGIENKNVRVTADPALTLDIADKARGLEILKNEGISKTDKILGVSVRRWQNLGAEFENTVAAVCDYAYEKYGYHTVFLPMQSSRDMAISQSIKRRMKNPASVIKNRYSVKDTMSVMSRFDLCIGMRLHTLIYAVINAIPIIGLVYDPKISSFMEYTHQTHYVDVENVTFDNLKNYLDDCIVNYDGIKNELENTYRKLKKEAQLNGKYAIELYEEGSVTI